ncbi:MAG: hypothetical protein EA360_07340 [Balneolaceae bacterium]|nr:MAG: hypothetical protein EA360_07340 [Balneolaceae bacterium]
MKGLSSSILLFAFITLLSGKVLAGDIDSNVKQISDTAVTTQELYIVTPVLLRVPYPSQAFHDVKPSFFERPGSRFISSLILPGSGQFANGNWVRGGIYLIAEALSIYYVLEYQNRGKQGERSYERFADQNWSVIQYANWLIEYHDYHKIENPYLKQLREMLNGISPTFNTSVEWNQISLSLLRSVERNTPYHTTDELFASLFSHTLPDFGSQQYYELISKYYQYQAGWRDYGSFHNSLGHLGDQFGQRFRIDRNGNYASPLFYEGVERSFLFNDNFRKSNRFKSLLIANHFISAFDAYFTLSMKQNRLNVTPTFYPGEQVKVLLTF